MPKPCSKPLCAGQGHFDEDECPGSEDDMHHCNDCGQLAWENEGNHCQRCKKYWCIDWQQVFVMFDCEHVECDEDSMCYECFLTDPSLWCGDYDCQCQCKRGEVQKSFLEFKMRGSVCGSHLLKGPDSLRISVYRWNGESRARVTCGQQEWSFDTMAKALQYAGALVREKQSHGYSTAKPEPRCENPSGVLK